MRNNYVMKKEPKFKLVITLKEILYIFLFISIIILIIIAFYDKWIVINFAEKKSERIEGKYITYYLNKRSSFIESIVFTLCVSLLFLAYIQSLGVNLSVNGKYTRIILILYILMLVNAGFLFTGIGIKFSEKLHLGLLNYDTFESNSSKGLKFYIENWFPLWIALFGISLIFEAKRKK